MNKKKIRQKILERWSRIHIPVTDSYRADIAIEETLKEAFRIQIEEGRKK